MVLQSETTLVKHFSQPPRHTKEASQTASSCSCIRSLHFGIVITGAEIIMCRAINFFPLICQFSLIMPLGM